MKTAHKFILIIMAIFMMGFVVIPAHASDAKYLSVKGGGVLMDPKQPGIRTTFVVTLERQIDLPSKAFVEVSFENPSDKTNPLIASQIVDKKQTTFQIESPEVTGIADNTAYAVQVSVYKNESKKKLLTQVDTTIQSLISEDTLRQKVRESRAEKEEQAL